MTTLHWLCFLAGVIVGAVLPPVLVWGLFRYDRRVMRRGK